MRRTTLTKSKAIVLSIATSFITLALLMVFLGGLGVMAPHTAQADVSADLGVIATGPVSEAIDVDVTTDVTVTFSPSVTNMTSDTFTLKSSSGEVSGTVTPTKPTTATDFTFEPDEDLAYNTTYTATLDKSLEYTEGLTLGTDYSWYFTTAQEPLEVSKGPADGAEGVAVSADVTATFNFSVTNVTSQTFMLEGPDGKVTSTIEPTPPATDTTFTLSPKDLLTYTTQYTATLKKSLEDTRGLTLGKDCVWTFTTTERALKVVEREPAKDAEDVAVSADIMATFNFSVTNVTTQTFMLEGPDGKVTSTIKPTTTAKMFTLCPDEELDYNTMYTVTLDESLKETKGLTLGKDCVWNFTTEGSEVAITKTVVPTEEVAPGAVVTYTIKLDNVGTGDAKGVMMTDTLPTKVEFGGWVEETGSATLPKPDPKDGEISWGPWTITDSQCIKYVFTATVTNTIGYNELVTNTVDATSDNAGKDCDKAVFESHSPTEGPFADSTKTSSSPGEKVMPGDVVPYTITLSNSSDMSYTVQLTDDLGAYYTVADTMDFTTTDGLLTWSGEVMSNGKVLHFTAQVVTMTNLSIGTTTLSNCVKIDDGEHQVSRVEDEKPPYVEIHGIYLPLVVRNFGG